MKKKKYQLRGYQKEAVAAGIAWVKRSIEPAVLELATGAGKSLIVAELADVLFEISGGKHVLCLAPSAELVTQNHEKFLLTGNPASVYSASAGQKCLRHPVIFATPGTFKSKARSLGSRFCAVIIDECHGITPTIQAIIDDMRKNSPNLRVIGLTATPYRLGTGYIYRMNEDGVANTDLNCRNPYFAKLLYRVPTHLLLEQGYLTPPVLADNINDQYDTLHLTPNSMGRFDAKAVDQAFVGHGRKTAAIVGDIVARAKNRRSVLIFAATVQHAHEVMASLPAGLSAIVTGTTPRKERAEILEKFKAGAIKYLVNVGVLTTGFDAPCVDMIALLRATESVSLLQQMVGRGLRLFDGKPDVLVADYAQNIARHCPNGDIFSPTIKAAGVGEEATLKDFKCPQCNTVQEFSLRPNEDGYGINEFGYFVDKLGQPINGDFGPIPAHFGRRCQALLPSKYMPGKLDQCSYRWTFKECPACEAENDIAARYCTHCRAELVDPNEKLILEFKAFKRDPHRTQTDDVVSIECLPTVSQRGKECLRADFVTPYRRFSIWYFPDGGPNQVRDYRKLQDAIDAGMKTVTYRKERDSNFYRVMAFNLPSDESVMLEQAAA